MKHYSRYHTEILEKLKASLAGNKSSKYPDLKKYIGTSYDFIGLSVPSQRKVFADGYSFSHLQATEQMLVWDEIWRHSSWYEAMTQALYFVKKIRHDTAPETMWEITRHWVSKVDNWAHSDDLSDMYAFLLEKDPGKVFAQLQAWNTSVNPWERRQSVVGLLEYSKKRVKILPVSKLLGMVAPLLNDNHYFVQKGVGWTLREIGNVYPEKTIRFLESHHMDLSPVAFTAAIEKLDPDTKERLKQWRRKTPEARKRPAKATRSAAKSSPASDKALKSRNSTKPTTWKPLSNSPEPPLSTSSKKKNLTDPPAPSKARKSPGKKTTGN